MRDRSGREAAPTQQATLVQNAGVLCENSEAKQ